MEFKSKPYRLYEIRGGGADESAISQRSMHGHKTWSAGMHDGTLGSCLMDAVEDAYVIPWPKRNPREGG